MKPWTVSNVTSKNYTALCEKFLQLAKNMAEMFIKFYRGNSDGSLVRMVRKLRLSATTGWIRRCGETKISRSIKSRDASRSLRRLFRWFVQLTSVIPRMNREEAKRSAGKIRAAFVSIKEQMCHKGEVPTGRANSIGSRSKPILAPRVEPNRRCVAPSSNFEVAAKILPTVKHDFIEIFPY